MNVDRIHIIALSISLLLHGAWMIRFGGNTGVNTSQLQAHQSLTRLSFTQPAPMPEQIPESKPEPVVEPPVPEPLPETKPVEKARKVARKKAETVIGKQQPAAAQAAAAPATESAPQIDPGVLAREKEQYLANVMAHVEKHKHYPSTARRRGIQGDVSVRFVLYPDGSARHIEVSDGPSILLTAAQQTVEKAVPLPAPPTSVPCPLPCHFRMRFALNAG